MAQQRKQPGLGRRSMVECLPCMQSPKSESQHHRPQGPEGQDVCCKTASPTCDRETAPMKSQKRGCLNKTNTTSRVSMPAPSLAEEGQALAAELSGKPIFFTNEPAYRVTNPNWSISLNI